MNRSSPLALALLLVFGPGPLAARTPVADESRQQFALESGVRHVAMYEMTARGTLVVEPDGRVSEATLDMPRETRELYLDAIRRWTFQPVRVDGAPIRAKAHFLLAATAHPIEGRPGEMRLGVENVWFLDPPETEAVAGARAPRNDLKPPVYPSRAAQADHGAALSVLVKLDAEGRVIDAGITRFALAASEVRSTGQSNAFARQFVESTLAAARTWVIRDPSAIGAGSAIVPVVYHSPHRQPGGWQPRIPLEVTPLPWMLAAKSEAVAYTPAGEATSPRFRLVDDASAAAIN